MRVLAITLALNKARRRIVGFRAVKTATVASTLRHRARAGRSHSPLGCRTHQLVDECPNRCSCCAASTDACPIPLTFPRLCAVAKAATPHKYTINSMFHRGAQVDRVQCCLIKKLRRRSGAEFRIPIIPSIAVDRHALALSELPRQCGDAPSLPQAAINETCIDCVG